MSNGPTLVVRLLGQFSLSLDGSPVEVPSRPAQSLLAWLILHPGVAHRREQLAGLFWPDTSESNARSNLRHALWRMRRAVPDGFVRADKISIRWEADADWQLDVNDLTALPIEADCADDLLPTLQAFSGELLPGFYDEWVIRQREQVAARYAERIARLLELLLAESRWREAIEWAEGWIAQGHTPEPAYRALMQAYAALGDRAGALTVYQRCINALEEELGAPPSPETEALADAIRNSQFPASPPPFIPSPAHPVIPSNLPAPTTPLIGRESELDALTELLMDPVHRLVTILGPGGMGKSRLALACGHAVVGFFPDGVFLVDLIPLAGPEAIPRAIGDALGYSYPNDSRPLAEQIADFLRSRKLLLLLDNFEHLLEGSALLVALLQAAPDLQLLVTTRERLHLQEETLFRLAGLSRPTATTSDYQESDYGAMALFLSSARRMGHAYQPCTAEWSSICRICQLLEGMPLAIILAVAWVEVLRPEEIADEIQNSLDFLAAELNNLPTRHRHIRSILEYSWRQLREDEQNTLMNLAIFASSISREAAQKVAGASLSVLNRLLDLALLVRESPDRFAMHEVVRRLAAEKLHEFGEEANARTALATFYGDFLHNQAESLTGPGVLQAVKLIEREWPNIRLALMILSAAQNIARLRSLLPVLGLFLNRPDRWQEGATLLARMTEHLQERQDPSAYKMIAYLLAWQGILLRSAGAPATGETLLKQSLAIVEELSKEETEEERAFVLLHLRTQRSVKLDVKSKIDDTRHL